jgi:hypothetical protein
MGRDNEVSESEDVAYGLMAGKHVGLAMMVAFSDCFGG